MQEHFVFVNKRLVATASTCSGRQYKVRRGTTELRCALYRRGNVWYRRCRHAVLVSRLLHSHKTCEPPPVTTSRRHQYQSHYAGRRFGVSFHIDDHNSFLEFPSSYTQAAHTTKNKTYSNMTPIRPCHVVDTGAPFNLARLVQIGLLKPRPIVYDEFGVRTFCVAFLNICSTSSSGVRQQLDITGRARTTDYQGHTCSSYRYAVRTFEISNHSFE